MAISSPTEKRIIFILVESFLLSLNNTCDHRTQQQLIQVHLKLFKPSNEWRSGYMTLLEHDLLLILIIDCYSNTNEMSRRIYCQYR